MPAFIERSDKDVVGLGELFADACAGLILFLVLIMAGKYGRCRLSHSEWYCSRQLGGVWDR